MTSSCAAAPFFRADADADADADAVASFCAAAPFFRADAGAVVASSGVGVRPGTSSLSSIAGWRVLVS
ncbi:hypothetical protein JK361_09570 [Streptomyces sp. 5-8]|uniref:Uncharacterized protein n=1 Tax=Streptomyces musisoli TaxID=2802280 RepID=A0ABS1NXK3_9ACTN|nr:hypothetical protein [Streptomyces musisoli]MBL1104837.1 hypothetical protein [Streptomyces musisoli]